MEKCRPNNADYYGDNYGKQQLVVADVMTALVMTHCISDVRYNRLDGHHDLHFRTENSDERIVWRSKSSSILHYAMAYVLRLRHIQVYGRGEIRRYR